jgi:hypothetical protein
MARSGTKLSQPVIRSQHEGDRPRAQTIGASDDSRLFRFTLCAWVGQTVISVLLALNALVWRSPWDPPSFFLALGLWKRTRLAALLLLSGEFAGYRLRH